MMTELFTTVLPPGGDSELYRHWGHVGRSLDYIAYYVRVVIVFAALVTDIVEIGYNMV